MGERVVLDVAVKIEGLRVFEIGVGHVLRFGRPIGAEESALPARIKARAEVVQLGFGVVKLAGEVVAGGVGASGLEESVAEGQVLVGSVELAGRVGLGPLVQL